MQSNKVTSILRSNTLQIELDECLPTINPTNNCLRHKIFKMMLRYKETKFTMARPIIFNRLFLTDNDTDDAKNINL